MPDTTERDDWQQFLHALADGDPLAAERFWSQYGERLLARADQKLAVRMRRRVGPETVVQSVCRTFLRRAGQNQFQLPDSDSLWRLLCAITLAKVREHVRFHHQQKRSIGREMSLDDPGGEQTRPHFEPEGGVIRPDHDVEFADQLENLLGQMDEEERAIVEMKLEERSSSEIAEKLGCSERTIRRRLNGVQTRLRELLDTDASGA